MKQTNMQREYQKMKQRLIEQTTIFPEPHGNLGYWHLHIPGPSTLFDGESTPSEVQLQCAQLLIDRTYHLAQIAPKLQEEVRVVAAIATDNLWDSQIIVFFGPNYFGSFFNRNSSTQIWSKIEGESLVEDWNLKCPKIFSESGYDQTIHEADETFNIQTWFIGQLK